MKIAIENRKGSSWIINEFREHKVVKIEGIESAYSWEGDNNHCWIDAYIGDLIDLFNKKGFATEFSCSGIQEDHTSPMITGYICFKNRVTDELHQIFKDLGFKPSRGDFYKRSYHTPNYQKDSDRRNLWDQLWHGIFMYEKKDGQKEYGVDRITLDKAKDIFQSITRNEP